MRAFSVLFLNQNCPTLFSIITVTKYYQKVSLRMSRYKLTEFSICSPNHPTLKVRQDLDGLFHIMYTILFDLTSLWAPLLKGRTYFFFRRAPLGIWMWISRKDFIVLPYLCSQEYMVERRAYHLSQKKTHQKIARFRSVSVKRKERPLIEGLGVQKQPFKAITWRKI